MVSTRPARVKGGLQRKSKSSSKSAAELLGLKNSSDTKQMSPASKPKSSEAGTSSKGGEKVSKPALHTITGTTVASRER